MLIPEPCIQNAVLLLLKPWLMPNYFKQKTVKRENLFLDFTLLNSAARNPAFCLSWLYVMPWYYRGGWEADVTKCK